MNDNYKIKYSSKDQFYVMVVQRIGEWLAQLEDLEKKMSVISNMESFQGKTADSVKSYLNEVHNILLISVRQTILDFQYKINLFSNGYYNIEPNIYANISSETLRALKNRVDYEKEYLFGQHTEIQSSINKIADLIQLNNPSQENILGALSDTAGQVDNLDKNISEYEKLKKEEASGELADLIASLYSAINTYYLMQGQITGYKSGDYSAKTEILDLYDKVSSSMEYTETNREAVIEANGNIQEVFEQQQKDYEEACEARKDEGTANFIVGALAVAGGVAAIVLTAGAATPVVVVATVSGGCATAYGVSNMVEGAQDQYYGSVGDLSSDAWNPIRDTVFCGNQSLYDAWGSISLTVAGLCVPINSAVNSVAGASGKVIAKEVTKTVVKESVKGFVVGETSEFVTNYVADELDLNKTQTLILNEIVESGIEKGVDVAEDVYVKQRDGAIDGDFTDGMSYEEARRYNEFMNDSDMYRSNLAQVDVSAMNNISGQQSNVNWPNNNTTTDFEVATGSIQSKTKIDFTDSNDIEVELESPEVSEVTSIASETESIDYSQTANTAQEHAILKDMEVKNEFDVGKNSYEAIEIDPLKADPKDPNRRLPTDKNGTIIGNRESGNFEYIPDDIETQKIMSRYGEKTVKYKNDAPNFSPYTKHDSPWGTIECEVEIGHMVGVRVGTNDNLGNYQQADIALSEKISSETGQNVTPEQIKTFRENSNLTWHETSDGITMQLVPTEINSNCAHKGGVSAKLYEQAWGDMSLNY